MTLLKVHNTNGHVESVRHDLEKTQTVCPKCLRPVAGIHFERDGRVWLERDCPEHGFSVGLVSSDRRHWYCRDEVPHPPPSEESCCSPGPAHRTCLALLEITQACNLNCPACYALSPHGAHTPLDELKATLDGFVRQRGALDVLQISGGEPTVHPDLLAILDYARTLPIAHVMINTNGIALAKSESLAKELARRRPRLELYLQMDGLTPGTQEAMRGKDLLDTKRTALQRVVEHDLPTTLVCTVDNAVNIGELGELLRLGVSLPQIRGVVFQPATWSGRYTLGQNPSARTTAADVIHALKAQSGGLLGENDFKPLPCSNPNCALFTFIARPKQGPPVSLSRLVDYEAVAERLQDRVFFTPDDAAGCCGTTFPPEELFRVVIKPFMDAWTFDQSRIDECCTHIMLPGGESRSFCAHNILHRRAGGPPQSP